MTSDADSAEEPQDSPEDGNDEMTWETEAREAIQKAVAGLRFDEVRGRIYLMSGHDHRWNSVEEEFKDAEEIRTRLTEIGEDEWVAYAPFDGGAPVFEPDVEDWVNDAIADYSIEEFFELVSEPDEEEETEEGEEMDELLSAQQLLTPGAGLVLEIDIQEISDELIRQLARHPEKMREIEPRKFELLVAELFKDKGYDVEVTPRSKDGGLDIRVVQKSELGTFLILVECKRYAAHQPVGVAIVRGLYGVVNMENATSGLIATTSSFTKGAKSAQQKIKTRLKLADFEELKGWLAAYCRKW